MSLMSSLYTGVSGLSAGQNGINTTSHNLANVETKGYTRQQSIQKDTHYTNLQGNYYGLQQVGIGTSISQIRQLRDMFLDKAYRQSSGKLGFYEEQYGAIDEVESFFGEIGSDVSFQKHIESFYFSVSELAKEPDDIVKRSNFINTAVTFLEKSDIIRGQLNDYQVSLNTRIKEEVSRINELGDKIYQLNKKISKREAGGAEEANDLRDARNDYLDELSKLIDIRYSEDINGEVRVIAENQPFVSEDRVYHLSTMRIADDPNTNIKSNMIKVVWKDFPDLDVFDFSFVPSSDSNTDSGSLKGMLLARGDKIADYTDIPIKENYTDLAEFEKDKAKYNTTINASILMNAQAQFDQLIHGIVTMINDVLCPNIEKTFTDVDGNIYSNVMVLDTDKASVGMGDENEIQGTELFSRKTMDRYTEVLGNDGVTYYVYNEENADDKHSLYSLGEIEVNQTLLKNYSLLPISTNKGTGDHDLKVAEKLLDKWDEAFATLNPNDLDKINFNSYYINFIGEISNKGNTLYTISTTQDGLTDSIDFDRQSLMSVSTDEELTNLIKFQHAYNASARYVNVVSEMLEHLVTRLA